MRRTFSHALLFVLPLLATVAHASHDTIPDPPPRSSPNKLSAMSNVDGRAVTVSGLSSGGFFAHQFHIAFSTLVNGAGIIAGGPFGCVEAIPNPYFPFVYVALIASPPQQSRAPTTMGACFMACPLLRPGPLLPCVSSKRLAADDSIDDPTNVSKHRVWLFHGRDDRVVPRATAEALKEVYENLGLRAPELRVEWNESGRIANHGMPVAQFMGESRFPRRECDQHEPPYVVQCGYEAAEMLFRHLYDGKLSPPSDDPHRDGTLAAFDQSEFFAGAATTISMHAVGYLYVPAICEREQCRLHVAFHGCRQDIGSIHDDFVRDAGYNRWAASNHIVVLYPQIAASPDNPNRCWDFWGYTGRDYYGRGGKQMRTVKAMIDRLLGSSR